MNAEFHMMVMIASTVPLERIVENIKDAATELSIFPDDEDKRNTLLAHCTMLKMHLDTKGTLEGAMNLIKDLEAREKKLSMFDINNLLS